MTGTRDRLLKGLVVFSWLCLLMLALGGISFLLHRGATPEPGGGAASLTPEGQVTLAPLVVLLPTDTLTPLLPSVPVSTGPLLPAASTTAEASPTARILSPTPTVEDSPALLFIGEDGCSVRKVEISSGQVLTLTLQQPSLSCREARLSPAGDRLAFLTGGTSSRLYTMNLDGSDLHQVSQEYVYGYAWDPEGQELVYAAYIADQGLVGLIFVHPDGSGRSHSSYAGVSLPAAALPLAWSPDGQWIYAPVETPPGGEAFPFALGENGTEWVQLSETSLDPATPVRWSADGRSVYFIQYGADFQYEVSMLKRLGLDGSREVVFYDDPSIEAPTLSPEGTFTSGPFWSPDGRSGLVMGMSAMVAGQYQLLVWDSVSGALHLLASLGTPADFGVWSPAGSRIAFLSEPDPQLGGDHSLMVLALAGTSLSTLVQGVAPSPPVWVMP